MSKLVLIDGNAILHRAYHAIPPLTTPNGEPINAVYGFVSMLLKITEDLKPTHLSVCFDRPEPTFRHEMYEKYQIQRPEVDDELIGQFSKAREAVRSFGIPIFEKAGYEADDLLGTLAKRAVNDTRILGYKDIKKEKSRNIAISQYRNISLIDEVVIVTGDKDILQLVDDTKNIKVYMPVKGLSLAKLMGEVDVVEKLGITPDQVVDYKSLVGDPSDNYPGVFGIGPKTAVGLLSKYKSKDSIYSNLSEINLNVRNKLEKDRENAELSYKLATIKTDVDVKIDFSKMTNWKMESPEAERLFTEYGFRSLKKRSQNLGKKIEEEKQASLF